MFLQPTLDAIVRKIMQIVPLEFCHSHVGMLPLTVTDFDEPKALSVNEARLPGGKVSAARNPLTKPHHFRCDQASIESTVVMKIAN